MPERMLLVALISPAFRRRVARSQALPRRGVPRTTKGNTVVVIGVGRHWVGRDNGPCRPLPLHHKSTGTLRMSSVHLTVEEIRALPNILGFAIFALYLTNGMP